MKNFEKTVTTEKSFDDAVAAIEKKAAENSFRVLHIHDVAATLADKGFPREPLKIIEICNAKYASQVLKKDVRIALMLPCPISVYLQGGKTFITTLLPSLMAEFYPQAGIDEIARQVEDIVLKIVEEKDATTKERQIREINTGIYCVESRFLFTAVAGLGNRNAQKEYYLTDIVEIACKKGMKVDSCLAGDPLEVMGINTPEDLERAGRRMESQGLRQYAPVKEGGAAS